MTGLPVADPKKPCMKCGRPVGPNGVSVCDDCMAEMVRPWWMRWLTRGAL